MADSGLDSTDQGSTETVVLPAKLTIALAADYFQRLMSKAEQGQDVVLDAHAVERIDAAGIQLLVPVQQALMEADTTLRWVTISDALREAIDLLGLTGHLALPAER